MANATAELAQEYWKLLRSFEKLCHMVPLEARDRVLAQARYANSRLDSILSRAGMRVVTFDGAAFETNLPAVAINADDFAGEQTVVVERTIEPAIISDMVVVLMGKVLLADVNSAGS